MSITKVNQTSKGSKPLVMVFIFTFLISTSFATYAFVGFLASPIARASAWASTQLLLRRVSSPNYVPTTVSTIPAVAKNTSQSIAFQAGVSLAVGTIIDNLLFDYPTNDKIKDSENKDFSLTRANQALHNGYKLPPQFQTITDLNLYISQNLQDFFVEIQCNANNTKQIFTLDQHPQIAQYALSCIQVTQPTFQTVVNSNNTCSGISLTGVTNALSAIGLYLQRTNGTSSNGCVIIRTHHFFDHADTTQYTSVFGLQVTSSGYVDGVVDFGINENGTFDRYDWELDDEQELVKDGSDQIAFTVEDETGTNTTYLNLYRGYFEYDNQFLDAETQQLTRNRFIKRVSDGQIILHDNEIQPQGEIINYYKANGEITGNTGTQTQTEIEIKEETETKTQNLTAIDTQIETLTQTKNEVKSKLETALQTDTYTDPQTQTEYDFIGKIEQLFNEFQIQDPQLDLPELPNITLIPQFTPGDPVACEPIPFNYEAPTSLTSYLNATSSIDICNQLGLARDLLGYTFYLVTLFFGWTSFYRQGRGS